MPETYSVKEFLESEENLPILDVRSPGEFNQGHIPGAINLPLFTDEERAEIGTLYKQVNPNVAIRKALEFIGPKLSQFVRGADQLGSPQLKIYCWRGGQRSSGMSWLLQQANFKTYRLDGGYKAYRSLAMDYFQKQWKLNVLTGYTGSRKTEILEELKKLGEQVIDLENLANHQGSAFGRSTNGKQPTPEQFQNELFSNLMSFDFEKRIWVEDESMTIGGVYIPVPFFQLKNSSPHIFIHISKAERIQHLVANYGKQDYERLIVSTRNISKKLGNKEATDAIRFLESSQLCEAADIILRYYDKRYSQSLESKKQLIIHTIDGTTETPETLALKLVQRRHDGIL